MLTIYQLKVGLCLIAFYLVWKLLLSRETLHRFNRVVLLLVTLLAFALPFVKLTLEQASPMSEGMIDIEGLFAVSAEVVQTPQEESLNIARYIYIIYLIGVGVMLLWRGWSLWMLWRTMRQGRVERLSDGSVMHVLKGDVAPFSYFRHIVINEQDLAEAGQQILTHEQAHIRLGHSWDVLLTDVLIVLQWWNPAAWLLRRELKQVHEYEADEAVLERGIDARQYQLLLIRKSVGNQLFSMANNFNYQSLKKRIRMMTTKKRSSRWQQLRALTVVPVAALALVAFAQPEVKEMEEQVVASMEAPEPVSVPDPVTASEPVVAPEPVSEPVAAPVAVSVPSEQPAEVVATAPADTTKTFEVVEQMPKFPGGDAELMKFFSENMKYPKDAQEAKKQGRVVVTFVVDADGQVVEPSVVKSVYPSLDEEALRVIGLMPKWTPGMQKGKAVRVKYTVPVTFRLPEDKAEPTGTTPIVIRTIGDSNLPNPLIIIDGKEATKAVVEALDPQKIESIDVLKEKTAEELYGEKGKNGVVIIKLKK